MLRYLRFAREMWKSEVNDAVVARLAPEREEVVMDIGAGAGAGTMAAVKSGCAVVAVEPTPYMRRVLGIRRLIGRVGDQVRIVDGAAEATGVDTGSIDAAWAVNTMHHWTDLDAGVAELARVLAPGGRVLLVDENFDDPAHPDYEKFGSGRDEHDHHFQTVDPESVAAGLRRAGLVVDFAGFDQIAGRPSIVIEASA
jgi:SAM-dependent methyltransferase